MIDVNDPNNHGKPLWVIVGRKGEAGVMCVTLRAYSKDYGLLPAGEAGHHVCIWGYSVYRSEPGFRTLGVNVVEWIARHNKTKPRFFDSYEDAMAHLRKMMMPARALLGGKGKT